MIHRSPGILLSYPRSGNHLVRFLIEFSTGKPTSGCLGNPRDRPLCENIYPCEVNPLEHVRGAPDYFKHHWIWELERNQINNRLGSPGSLIVILRNPIECISRHIGYSWSEDHVVKHAREWRNIAKFFQKFPGPKHLMRYEHLIDASRKYEAIEGLLSFIKADDDLMQNLLNKLDDYMELCRRGSNRDWSGSVSRDETHYHANRVDRLDQFRDITNALTRDCCP